MSLQQIIVLCKLYIAHYFFKSTLLGIVSVFTIHCWLLRFSTMNCWLALLNTVHCFFTVI